MTSLAIHMLQGDALRMEQFFKHASCPPTPQFEDFNHVNADATDETKMVTTKFVLGFCHGRQLRFCLLVRIGPISGNLPASFPGPFPPHPSQRKGAGNEFENLKRCVGLMEKKH